MDNLNLFSDKADNYVKARPSYAPALLDKLEEYGLKKGSCCRYWLGYRYFHPPAFR